MGTLLPLTLIVVDQHLPFTAAVRGQVELINSVETLGRVLLEAAGHHIKCLFAGSRRVSHLSGDPPRRDKATEVLRSYNFVPKHCQYVRGTRTPTFRFFGYSFITLMARTPDLHPGKLEPEYAARRDANEIRPDFNRRRALCNCHGTLPVEVGFDFAAEIRVVSDHFHGNVSESRVLQSLRDKSLILGPFLSIGGEIVDHIAYAVDAARGALRQQLIVIVEDLAV